mgnify:CR=1 FL=1
MKITRIEPIHLRLPDVNERCDGSQDTEQKDDVGSFKLIRRGFFAMNIVGHQCTMRIGSCG